MTSPDGVLVLPKGVTYNALPGLLDGVFQASVRMTEVDFQILSKAYYEYPQTVLSPTYESYRRALYGWPARDWFPVLNYGLLGAGLALIGAILYLALSSA